MELGTLYLVATPIGNLEDLSPRAQRTLTEVELILAEDTRKFAILARRFDIATPCKSFYEHNERARVAEAIERLRSGADIALVSEAGTPLISDPGYRLVSEARAEELPITTIPGPCALVSALVISGFETHRFYFEGFLSHKPGKKQRALEAALGRDCPSIFYESPHRIVKTLTMLAELKPTAEVFVARELTKRYEESLRGTAAELSAALGERKQVKGELVLIVRGVRR